MAHALVGLLLLVRTSQADIPAPDGIDPDFAARLWCIEEHESGHDPTAVNKYSGARGYLQWLPGTARTWDVVIGSRQSEWSAAAAIHDVSEAFFRTQWPVTARICS